ncbi:MAG TPA: carboxypeptidase regulatory-like domain-containing protein, partial [Rhodothermales bacterium]|nr:carboxypeptidase regulatory-like domain-containing protein [Rhodothermales bacterium]
MRFHPFALLLLGALLLAPVARAQQPATPRVVGTILDGRDRSTMPGVNVVLMPARDSTMRFGGVTDTLGRFSIGVPAPGPYRLRASFIGYRILNRNVTVTPGRFDAGQLVMVEDSLALDQLLVETEQVRMQMRGDTLEYRADAFAVNRNATAEDLVSKMPGITIQNGQIQAQGETVRRVTVDGEEFFGNDAAAALRNLPAEAIQSVQVSDRQSDQARLTGFDDGNREKTMNLVTRPNYRNGQFGRVYGGYGTDNRFLGGGTVNVFKGTHRVSVIGLANNVGQQNFAIDDILGAMSGGGRGGNVQVTMVGGPGGGGMMRGPGGGGNIEFRGGPGMGGGPGFDFGNFLTAPQNGLTTTGALGLNYSGRLGQKTRLSGSYFVNGSGNDSDVRVDRQYAAGVSQGLTYNETNDAESTNYNHRLNGRVEVNFNERSALIFSPRISLQSNRTSSLLTGLTNNANGSPLSRTVNDYDSDDLGVNTGFNLVYRQGFAKPGRSVSLNLNGTLNSRNGDATQNSRNTSYRTGSPVEALLYDQQIDSNVGTTGFNANLAFTERLGRGQLQLNYNPGFTRNDSQRDALAMDPRTGGYTRLDSAYTNRYENTSITQRGGGSYQIRNEKWFVTGGVNLQHEQLTGNQQFPTVRRVDQDFFSVLPNAQIAYTPSRRGS